MKNLIKTTALILTVILLFSFSSSAFAGMNKTGSTGDDDPVVCTESGEQDDVSSGRISVFRMLLIRLKALFQSLRALFSGDSEKPSENDETEITEVYTNKAIYEPGEIPVVTVRVFSKIDVNAELKVIATHFTKKICEGSSMITLRAGETTGRTVRLELPSTDFTAYSVEVYLIREGETTDKAMTAVEVASDWSRYPRYGYLTKYGEQTEEQIDATLERLNRHHITGLFFYDVLDRHDKPLAGTAENPDATWKTLAGSTASFATVKGLIDRGHDYGMNSYLYNLLFGAYQDYAEKGISPEWGLYKDNEGKQQDFHGELPSSWETQRIYLFNPLNAGWQEHYLNAMKEALDAFGYDGVQADSLGGRGDLFDYDGNPVNLAESYSPLLNRLHDELGTRVIFNPVSSYGMPETMANTDYDIAYEEFWPHDGRNYSNLRDTAFRLKSFMKSDKGLVIAAYMNKNSSTGEFNPAGILLTDAVLMASGAAHLELGDTGMLRSEYYPGSTHRISEELENALLSYNSFFVAYENVLRDPSFVPSYNETKINRKKVSDEPEKDTIWRINRENESGEMLLSFINLNGVSSLEWADENGTQAMPEAQKNLRVKQHVSSVPKHIYLASPDIDGGIMTEIPFTSGKDLKGSYVSFTMPELEIWNAVYLAQ